jgi:ribosomal protein S6E (S10)
MRLHTQQQAEDAYQDRLVAHDDGAGFTKYLKGLQRQVGGSGADGDAMVSDLKATGAIR